VKPWSLTLCLFFGGCVSLPKQVPQMTVLLGNQIIESKQSHLDMVDRWADVSRKRVEQYIEYKLAPEFIMAFMDPKGEPHKNLKARLKEDCVRDTADEVKAIVEAISSRIERERKRLLQAVDRQAVILKDKVRAHYAESERLHRSIMGGVQSVAKGKDLDKQIREAMLKPLKKIAPIDEAEQFIDGLLKQE
jgi:hypothetical protein